MNSDHDVSGFLFDQNLENAAFSGQVSTASAAPQPESPPQTIEEMYALFVRMRSDFNEVIKERDRTISDLTTKVATLEAEVKKKPTNTADSAKMMTDMKE